MALRAVPPPQAQAGLPRPLDHAHQRRRARPRHLVLAADRGARQGQHRARSQDPLGPGDQRSGRVQEGRRDGARGLAAPGGAPPTVSRGGRRSAPCPALNAATLIAELDRLAGEFAGEIGGLATEQEIRLAQARYLGKKGKVSELMKALGRLPAEDRPAVGEAANRAKGSIEGAVGGAAGRARRGRAWRPIWRASVDVTLPPRGRAPGHAAPADAGAPRDRGDLPRPRLRGAHRPVDRDRVEQLRRAQHAAGPPRARHAGHLLRRGRAHPALAHLAGADPHDAGGPAAGADHRARQRLPPRRRRHPHADVPADRGAAASTSDVSFADLKGTLLHFVHRFFGPQAWACACAPATSRSPSPRPRSTPPATCASGTASADGARACRLCKGSGLDRDRRLGDGAPERLPRRRLRPAATVSGFAFGMGLSRMAMLKYGVDDLRVVLRARRALPGAIPVS